MYYCNFCPKRFVTSSSISQHMKRHIKPKIIPCEYPGCKSTFTRRDNMKQHMRVHLLKIKIAQEPPKPEFTIIQEDPKPKDVVKLANLTESEHKERYLPRTEVDIRQLSSFKIF